MIKENPPKFLYGFSDFPTLQLHCVFLNNTCFILKEKCRFLKLATNEIKESSDK